MWQPYLFLSGCCLAKEIRSLLDTSWWDSCFNQFSCGRGWGGCTTPSERRWWINHSFLGFSFFPFVLWCQQRKIKGVKVMPSLVPDIKKVSVKPKCLVPKLRNALTWELQAKVAWCCWKCVAALTFWMIGWSPWSWQFSTLTWTRSFYVQVHATCVAIPENSVDTVSRLQGITCFTSWTVVCWVRNLQLGVFAPGGHPFLWLYTEGAGRGTWDLNIDGQCMLMQRLGNEVCECMRIIIELTFLNCSYLHWAFYSCPFAWILWENKRFFGCGAGQRFRQGEYWWDLQETPAIPEKFQTTTRKTTTMCL